MPEVKTAQNKGFSVDWLVKGTLTKLGDIFDRLTGRGWKPSSSLATSELIERLKMLMDSEVRKNDADGRSYVPHNIKLKMQWDKFSTDSDESLRKLENEFLVAAIDHINDRHYYTYAPLSIVVKPDYFTSGVKLYLSFDKLEAEGAEAELQVTVDEPKGVDVLPEAETRKSAGRLTVSFTAADKPAVKEFLIEEGRRLGVGRTKENDIAIDEPSVSKAHASLMLGKDAHLVVADTGSTNGTFVRGERIPYGKAIGLSPGDDLMFGTVRVKLHLTLDPAPELPATCTQRIGEFEFSSRSERGPIRQQASDPRKTRTKDNDVTQKRSAAPDADAPPPQPAASEPKIVLADEGTDRGE